MLPAVACVVLPYHSQPVLPPLCCRASEGDHAKLRADIVDLLALVLQAPLPAAAVVIVTIHDVLDANLQVRWPDDIWGKWQLQRAQALLAQAVRGCPSNETLLQ